MMSTVQNAIRKQKALEEAVMRVTILASTFLLLTVSAAFANNRPLTDQERARLTEAVTAQGCSGGKMKVDDKKFEVDDATCADGKKYELEFDAEFMLIKKEVED